MNTRRASYLARLFYLSFGSWQKALAGWFNLALIYAEQNCADASDRMKHYLELVSNTPDANDARANDHLGGQGEALTVPAFDTDVGANRISD